MERQKARRKGRNIRKERLEGMKCGTEEGRDTRKEEERKKQ